MQAATSLPQADSARRFSPVLAAAMLVQFAAAGAVVPFVTLLFRDRGLTFGQASLVMSSASLTLLVVPFFWGMLADRYLALERVFLLLNVLACVSLGVLATQHTFTGLLVAFTAYYAFLNPSTSLVNALSFHHLPNPREQFGRVRAWGSWGWVLPFLPISLWLAVRPDTTLDFTLYLGMAFCLGMAALSFRLPHTPPGARRRSGGGTYLPAVRRLLADPDYVVVLVVFFLIAGSFSLVTFYSSPFLEDLGVGRAWIGPIQAIGVVFEIVLFRWQPFLLRRWNYTGTILVGCGCLLTRQLMFAGLENLAWLAVSYLLTGATVVFCHISINMLVNALAPAEVRATAQTVLLLVGYGIGPAAVNWIAGLMVPAGTRSLHGVFLFGAILAVLAGVLLLARRRRLDHAGARS